MSGPDDQHRKILEFQIDQLRGELEALRKWRDETVYSAAWRFAWPVRTIENALRRSLRRSDARAAASQIESAAAPTRAFDPAAGTARLLIDVTAIVGHDDRTGIQRVVKKVVGALYADNPPGVYPLAVRLAGERLVACESYGAALGQRAPRGPDAPIAPCAGDVLLMLDSSWKDFARFAPVFGAVRAAGGRIASVIYDLIPQLYPGACVGDTPRDHGRWLAASLSESDAMVAISQTVADELRAFVAQRGMAVRPGLRIGWFHCGSDFAPDDARSNPSQAVARAFADAPAYLIVSTLEPRKGHAVALAAFEKLWADSFAGKLVFIGRPGWNLDAFLTRLRAHPEMGRRLFWFDHAGDEDLSYAYDRCAAVLAPSYAEGFGLSVAEAAAFGKTAICSDIPVFREIGRDGALYFAVNDADALARTVRDFAQGRLKGDPSRVIRPRWAQAARQLAAEAMRAAPG
ncbi:MAG: glycosyltransferase family 4 protein [Hyphomicrobiales bacterium]|nr:glycosyltransferase family 4 protein [Hyphomicrobiales bacterium]